MDPTVAALMKIGGHVERDERRPNRPIIEVQLGGPQVNDAVMEKLKGLSELRSFGIGSCPNVTAAGIANVKGLKKLVSIHFHGNDVKDAWLEPLEGMTQIKSLSLYECINVTDVGLEHLKGLANLKDLRLVHCTGITDAGIAHLKGMAHLELPVSRLDQDRGRRSGAPQGIRSAH